MVHLVILLLCFIPLVASINFVPAPIYYITQTDITSKAKETFIFNMALCGGKQFDHFDANVFVNFPDKRWNPAIGDYVSVQVYDIHGHFIANNLIGGNYVHDFSFHYHSVLGDLKLNVTSGNVPDLKYTITVTFTDPKDSLSSNNRRISSRPLAKTRYYSNEEEMVAWEKIKATFDDANTQDMATVFRTTVNESVDTADVIGLGLGYCFNPKTFPGSVFISVLANDEISGFATYACTHEQNCTSTEVAKFFDISGASVNFVRVRLTMANQAGAVNVLVRGDGRFESKNTFTLGASMYIPDSP